MKEKPINIITLILSLLAGVVTVAGTITPLPFVSKEIAGYWGAFVAAIPVIRNTLKVIADYLDDGKLNDSFKAGIIVIGAILGMSCLTGCVFQGEINYELKDGTTIGVISDGKTVTGKVFGRQR